MMKRALIGKQKYFGNYLKSVLMNKCPYKEASQPPIVVLKVVRFKVPDVKCLLLSLTPFGRVLPRFSGALVSFAMRLSIIFIFLMSCLEKL